MKKGFTYLATSIAAAAFLTAQPALGQQASTTGADGPKRILMECDISGKQCQVVRRLRSPAACQNSRVASALHHRASTFVCVPEQAVQRRTG
jgi:hypothetical protein